MWWDVFTQAVCPYAPSFPPDRWYLGSCPEPKYTCKTNVDGAK